MDCCCNGIQMIRETARNACVNCGEIGRGVARRTVAHHVKSEKLSSVVAEDEYKFCSSAECSVVYYSTGKLVFTVEDVRESVTAKAVGDFRPLCYCFGFTEGDVRKEVERTGASSVPNQITQFIKEKFCVCEIRNPAGVCCLGRVQQTARKFLKELRNQNEATKS